MAPTIRSQVQVKRLLDRSERRKPLRLWISRRAARDRNDEFVTQVRFGKAEAVVVPWVADEAALSR